jgi:hypothetical protein
VPNPNSIFYFSLKKIAWQIFFPSLCVYTIGHFQWEENWITSIILL